jgi:hypothetical protein
MAVVRSAHGVAGALAGLDRDCCRPQTTRTHPQRLLAAMGEGRQVSNATLKTSVCRVSRRPTVPTIERDGDPLFALIIATAASRPSAPTALDRVNASFGDARGRAQCFCAKDVFTIANEPRFLSELRSPDGGLRLGNKLLADRLAEGVLAPAPASHCSFPTSCNVPTHVALAASRIAIIPSQGLRVASKCSA